jgi:hypothetical protein
VTDAGVTDMLHLGSDHRTVKLVVDSGAKTRKKTRQYRTPKSSSTVSWRPKSTAEYQQKLDTCLTDALTDERLYLSSKSLDDKLSFLECQAVRTATECRKVEQCSQISKQMTFDNLKDLVIRRQTLEPGLESKLARLSISKEIQKELRKHLKGKKRAQIAERLNEFEGLKQLGAIRANGKRNLLRSVVDTNGELRNGRQEIVDVFAAFYGTLYARQDRRGAGGTRWSGGACEGVEAFTIDEARKQLQKMAKNRAADDSGLVVEMLQEASDYTLQVVVEIFNEILQPEPQTPDAWKTSRIKVLYKKGDQKLPENYRPITLLKILYKLFSRMINGRVQSVLDRAQPVDQAGFRPGFGVDDHLLTMVLPIERAMEFNCPLWLCTVDFTKAFDTVSHESVLKH